MFSLPPCPPLSLKSGSKVNVPFSLLGGTGWPFGLWDSDRLVVPFLLSFIRSLLGVQAFQLVRDGVLFDSVPFLGFFPSKDFNSPLSRWKDFSCSFLGPPGLLFVLSEDVFAPGFLGFFFPLFPWPFWILPFIFDCFPLFRLGCVHPSRIFLLQGILTFSVFSFIRKLFIFGSESRQFFT